MSPRRRSSPGRVYGGRRARGRRGQQQRRLLRRLEAIFRQARGRPDPDYDRRPDERPPSARTLSVRIDGELFDHLAVQDFEYLCSLQFAAGWTTLRDLLPQSVLGRAQNGHGWFQDDRGRPLAFPDATFDRVLSALERTSSDLRHDEVRKRRSRTLEELAAWVRSRPATGPLRLAIDGAPLLGVEFLRDVEVEASAFLTGMVLAGFMDDWRQRQMAVALHRVTFAGDELVIGGGEQHIIRPDRLQACGIVDPGRFEFTEEEIARLVEIGAVVAAEGDGRTYEYPEFDQAFFRRRLADGVSDDLALIWIGARHGWDAMLGGFVMDALDTYDKFLWRFVPGGFDGALAREIQERHRADRGAPLVEGREILDLIRFAAKRNSPPCPLSSSHRRFIQYEETARVPTLLEHQRFLEGRKLDDVRYGFSRLPARELYAAARERFATLGIEVPEPDFRAARGAGRRG